MGHVGPHRGEQVVQRRVDGRRGVEPPAGERPRKLTQTAISKMTKTDTSTARSKDLLKRGWRYVGPTTCYAFMQATGLVNDHVESCSTRATCERTRERFQRPRT